MYLLFFENIYNQKNKNLKKISKKNKMRFRLLEKKGMKFFLKDSKKNAVFIPLRVRGEKS